MVVVPKIVQWLFKNLIWQIPNHKKEVFLTFDDGPIPEVTEFVLDVLKKHNVQATFFCIGNNVEKHPEIFQKILNDGHAIGNHTYNHIKGWKTTTATYLEEVSKTTEILLQHNCKTTLFRPPYGRMSLQQINALKKKGYEIVMWHILSKDYDKNTPPHTCFENAVNHTKSGSIIVFHDSIKAENNLRNCLEKTIIALKERGFEFNKLSSPVLA